MTQWNPDLLKSKIATNGNLGILKELYSSESDIETVIDRLVRIAAGLEGDRLSFVSAPGRTELGGNHTDHNHGKVLCAAVQNDTLAAVVPRDDGKVCIQSDGFEEQFELNIADLSLRESEAGTSTSLIRGVLAGLNEMGAQLGGFTAHVTSNVAIGSGLSSSASFEVLIGCIVNELYNGGGIAPERIAQNGQWAENTYFGKPCGLMDQTASAVGGVLSIDFLNPAAPIIQKHEFDFEGTGYSLLVLNTGGSHADLTEAYATISAEMKAVAHWYQAEFLRSVEEGEIYSKLPQLRKQLGDRPVLRAMHFIHENKRVDRMVAALDSGDFDAYLGQVKASGLSSQNILQNSIPPASDGFAQGVTFALGLSQLFFEEQGRGVSRVHGGGFAGAIQSYVHNDDCDEYRELMAAVFGPSAIEPITIRSRGAGGILKLTD
ncbi:MAG: galactokinase [Candidatus Marinimicrobia bacterium]|nr:galactokinase [Candidatus Neomarinimicrobiota bacterium]